MKGGSIRFVHLTKTTSIFKSLSGNRMNVVVDAAVQYPRPAIRQLGSMIDAEVRGRIDNRAVASPTIASNLFIAYHIIITDYNERCHHFVM